MSLLGLFLLLITALGVFADEGYLIQGSKFVSRTHGFSIPIPENWGVEPITQEPTVPVMFVRPSGRVKVVIAVIPAEGETGLPSAAAMEKLSAKRFRGFQVVRSKDITLGGCPFREYVATGSRGTRAYKVYAGSVDSRLFLIWLEANQEAFEKACGEFTRSILQIQFEPRANPNSAPVEG